MPLTRIKNTAIGDDGVTTQKLDDTTGGFTLPGTQFVRVPVGTTAQRPSGANGYLRFNTSNGVLEQWNANTSSWAAIDSPPIITTVSYPGGVTAADPAGGETITVSGSNFQNGATVTIGGTSASSVTVASSSSITFTAPAKTAGDYDLVITNSNGLAATSTAGFSYNGTPSFTTAAGNIGSIESNTAMSTITIVAAEPDGGTLAYSVTSGSLPSGVSLGSANGQLTGTPTNVSTDTTFTFTVTATDDESQTNSRQFNLIVLRPVYVTQINQSLVFDGSSSAVVGTTATASTTYTVSMWVKRSGRFDDYEYVWSNGNRGFGFWSGLTDSRFYYYNGSQLSSSRRLRDVGTWMHVVFQNNAGTVTVWINGNQIYNASTGVALQTTTNGTHIGRYYNSGSGAYYYDGYMADYHFIDGLAKAPTDFATEYNGVWIPIAYAGTYPNSSVKLAFADASDLGNDTSGNNNDYALAGITSDHKKLDSPTINMATQNSLALRRDVTSYIPAYYNGNTHISYPNAGGNQTFGIATHEVRSGKWYFETYVKAENGNMNVGIGIQGDINSLNAHYHGYRSTNGAISVSSGSNTGSGASYTNGDVIGCAFDLDAGTIKWYKNNTLQSTTTGIDTNDYIPFVKGTTSEESVVNFGQDSDFAGYKLGGAGTADGNGVGEFYYAPPTGHLALCSKNIAESPLNTALGNQPEKNFSVTTWTGDNTNNRTFSLDFVPDFTWVKSTTQSYGHLLFDSTRVGKYHLIYATNAEANVSNFSWTNSGQFTGASNFVVDRGTNESQNETNTKYVAWNWKAGGKPTATNSAGVGATPTAGSVKIDGANKTDALAGTLAANKITANTKSGFSIVQYTGEGNGAKTIAHGLNSAPEMIWVKNLTDAENWCIYSSEIAATTHLRSNATSTASSPVNQRWNSTRPTNTVFSIGDTTTDNEVGGSGKEYVAYCWHSVPGFSKIGTYVGTGSANNGAFIYCGFKPAWIMVKTLSTTNRWVCYDNSHSDGSGTVNVQKNPVLDGAELEMNSGGAQGNGTNQTFDFYGNGFRVLRTGDVYNTASHSYMFMAFAEDSYKYAEGR